MTTFRRTLETYKSGQKQKAYEMFQDDPNALTGITFENFCKTMEKSIGRIQAIDSATGEIERS